MGQRHLTPSDLRIIRSLVKGNTRYKDIALDLGRTPGGVKSDLSLLYQKLGLNDLAGLAIWAFRNGFS